MINWFKRNYLGKLTGKKFLRWLFSVFVLIVIAELIF